VKKHFRSIYDDVVEAINHCREYALPLKNIELSDAEWHIFIDDHRFDGALSLHNRHALKIPGEKHMQFMGYDVFTSGEQL
jgi:hypothetical protein